MKRKNQFPIIVVLIASIALSPLSASAETIEDLRLMLYRGEIDKCMTKLQTKLSGDDGTNATAHLLMAKCLVKKNRLAEARTHFEDSVKYGKGSWDSEEAKQWLKEHPDASKAKPQSQIKSSTTKGGIIGFVGLGVGDKGMVDRVYPNSPAAAAGIQSGDRILLVDGVPAPDDMDTLAVKIRGLVGTSIKLVLERKGKKLSYTLLRIKPTNLDSQGPRFGDANK